MRENDTFRPRLTDPGVALLLLTRLPLPRLPDAAFARQSQAGWAYPLAGLAVALAAASAGALGLALGLPPGAAAGLALAVQIAVCGAMHEDGLADTTDGLWGGATAERRLEIMKDSRIGTFGVLALILFTGSRWMALAGLMAAGGWFGPLVAAAALSRAALPALMTALPPARPGGLARSVGVPGRAVSFAALGLGLAVAVAATGASVLLPALCAALLVAALARLALARIGGQTGDILGAAQQLAECALLLGLLAAL